ncbi:MAG: chloride channel protein [Candidatus Hodarchaeales archaeon]|jgi:CIC family chloride channel protein
MSSLGEVKTLHWQQAKVKYIIKKWLPISTVIGITSGILMALFLFFIQLIEDVIKSIGIIFIPIAVIFAGLLTAFLIKRGYKEVDGPGIGYIIELKNKEVEIPSRTVSTKFLASGVSLGSGMPGGAESSAFTMGGSLAYFFGKNVFNLKKEDLSLAVTIGSASCTSALFSAPLGGTLFASEVPFKRDIDMDVYLPAFFASIIAVITFFVIGTKLLQITVLSINFSTNIPFIDFYWIFLAFVFGSFLGVSSLIYDKLYKKLHDIFDFFRLSWHQVIVTSFLGAIIIGISFIFVENPLILDTRFELLNNLSQTITSIEVQELFMIFIFKALIVLILISGGNSIGIFAPSLVLGGLLGSMFAIIIGLPEFMGEFFILGMAGIFAGTAKTPISAMILILEITRLPQMILYMAIVTTIAYLVSGETGLYPSQLLDRREALRQKIEAKNYLAIVSISSIMTPNVITFEPDITVGKAKLKFKTTQKHTIPITDSTNQTVMGIISEEDLVNIDDSLILSDVMIKEVVTLDSDLSLQQVLQFVLNLGIEHFPVIDKETKKLEGFITLRDILNAYLEQELVFAR